MTEKLTCSNDAFMIIGNQGKQGDYCDGDIFQDGFIDSFDLFVFTELGVLGARNVKPGDANGDTVADFGDGFLIYRNLGVRPKFSDGVLAGFRQGDINSDGIVDIRDLELLLEILANPPSCP